jgi:hypothetical protein
MPHHLAILTDFPEEGWQSMDLCGDMLLDHLPRDGPFSVEAGRLCPPFRRLADQFDLFHIADHTYAQLVHALPADRVGVYCHDLDAFRSLLDPAREPRPRYYRVLARRILCGMQKAAVEGSGLGSGVFFPAPRPFSSSIVP